MPITISGLREGRIDYSHYAKKFVLDTGSTEELTWVYGGYGTIPASSYAIWWLSELLISGYKIHFFELNVGTSPNTIFRTTIYQYPGYTGITRKYGYEETVIKLSSGATMSTGYYPAVVIENLSSVSKYIEYTFKGIIEKIS